MTKRHLSTRINYQALRPSLLHRPPDWRGRARGHIICAMQFQVFVKNIAENNYLALVIGLPDCVGAGETVEAAVNEARAALQAYLRGGQITTIEVGSKGLTDNPWIDTAGIFKDDPTFDDFLEKLAEYRREENAKMPLLELEAEEATAAR